MTEALFVFAHQDDEVAAASRIAYELARGTDVHCVFLTDGGAPHVRNAESIAVLARLGVAADHIAFVPIADGTLVDHLQLALDRLEPVRADVVYCLAWEGGHHDHDASQLVAAAFAKKRGIECFEMPLYNGYRIPAPFFRVLSPIGGGWQVRRIDHGLTYAMLAWSYRSQRKSWLALFPEAFLKLAMLRREAIRPVDATHYRARPHEGRLYYERRFRFPYERFSNASSTFVATYF